jgi:hypothetical protein
VSKLAASGQVRFADRREGWNAVIAALDQRIGHGGRRRSQL